MFGTAVETNERILFVDDDEAARSAFSRTLCAYGFNVDLCSTPEEAVQMVKQNAYAVIAADHYLGDTTGLELIDHLRSLQPDSTCVLVSGRFETKLVIDALNNHGVPFVVPKPWDADDLNSIMRRSIETYWEKVGQKEVQKRMISTSRALQDQKTRLVEALATSSANMAELLLSALGARDFETRGHCRRVAAATRALAEAMGVRGQLLTTIEYGALLHDTGKIGVPDSILLKPEKLTPEEWEIMRAHSEIGARMLEGFENLNGAREIVLQHHERWDGTGYPRSLKGEEICLGARIFAIADALEAIMSDRPYRKGAPIETAVSEIVRGAGLQFDPKAVKAFVAIPREMWISVRTRFPDESPTDIKKAKV
jgi:putative nucleotidyltransferase with HDIG domain